MKPTIQFNATDTVDESDPFLSERQKRSDFDFVVCGAGSSGLIVAARLAEDGDARVLLLEAGGDDACDSVSEPSMWPTNLGTSRDWGFAGEPPARLDGRRLPLSMGKGLGGGSSIDVMVWARGHEEDWDHFAAAATTRGTSTAIALLTPPSCRASRPEARWRHVSSSESGLRT